MSNSNTLLLEPFLSYADKLRRKLAKRQSINKATNSNNIWISQPIRTSSNNQNSEISPEITSDEVKLVDHPVSIMLDVDVGQASSTREQQFSIANSNAMSVVSSSTDPPVGLVISTSNTLPKENNVTSSEMTDITNNFIGFDIINSGKIRNSASKNKQDSSDMWFKLFMEIILRGDILFMSNTRRLMITYCQSVCNDNDEDDKRLIDEIQIEPKPSQCAIRWYTSHTFLYRLVNVSLRNFKIDDIFNLRYFIVNLHKQLEYVHQEQLKDYQTSTLTVFRGEQLTEHQLSTIKENSGGLLAVRYFMSTSRDVKQARNYAKQQTRKGRIGVIFEITIDCQQAVQPFADISKLSTFPVEKEILFSVATVFRIVSVDNKDNIHYINLLLCKDVDEEQKALTEYIMNEKIPDKTNFTHLGQLMLYMNKPHKALEYYDMASNAVLTYTDDNNRTTVIVNFDPIEIGLHWYNKGLAYSAVGCGDKAIECCENAAQIWSGFLEPDNQLYSKLYSTMGNAYRLKANYRLAISYFEKQIEIDKSKQQLSLNSQTATAYCNIGVCYKELGICSKSLEYLMKSVELQENLPENHFERATTYHNIGIAYSRMNEFEKAMEYYEKACRILNVICEENDIRFVVLYNCIGTVHLRRGEPKTSILYYEKALQIQKNIAYTSAYSDSVLADILNNLGHAHTSINELQIALAYHKEAVSIRERSLPPDHPSLVDSYAAIQDCYYSMGDYSNACSYFFKVFCLINH